MKSLVFLIVLIASQQFYSQKIISTDTRKARIEIMEIKNPFKDTIAIANSLDGNCAIRFDTKGYTRNNLILIAPVDSIKLAIEMIECDSMVIEIALLKKMKYNKKHKLYNVNKRIYELSFPKGTITEK